MIEIYFIRHALALKNINAHLIGGRNPLSPLTEEGRQQAHLLGKRFSQEGIHFDAIYSSTALRARETATICSQHSGYPLDQIIETEEFSEVSQGEWEGRERKEVHTPTVLAQMEKNFLHFKAPSGESIFEAGERMTKAVENYILPKRNGTYAVFSHALSLKSYLRNLGKLETSLVTQQSLDNTALIHLTYGLAIDLKKINDTNHLQGTELLINPYR